MTMVFLRTGPAQRQALSAFAYCAVALGGLGFSYAMGSALVGDEAEVASLRERAARLESRARIAKEAAPADEAEASGSPFLEGQTMGLAGAALQQRIERAVTRSDGVLLSSQIDLDGPEAKNRFLTLTVSVEFAPPALQSFLYDIEGGTPCLFVDSLEVQATQAAGVASASRMRVAVSVSGQWEPTP